MSSIAARIDHTALKPEAEAAQVEMAVGEAQRFGFQAVCVNGCYVERVAELLSGSPVRLCAVAGFPFGAMHPEALAGEAAQLVRAGAQEIEFVAPLRHLIARAVKPAGEVMYRVVDAARQIRGEVVMKVVIESAALMRDTTAEIAEQRIVAACDAARQAGGDFVVTATGFHPAGGAAVEAVRLMRQHAAGMRVKAAGGIRTYDAARAMIEAGADRIGSSAGVAIVKGRPSAGAP